MKWQVQIFVHEVDEWFGWAHSPYDHSDRKDVERAERIAKQYGWKTRIIRYN